MKLHFLLGSLVLALLASPRELAAQPGMPPRTTAPRDTTHLARDLAPGTIEVRVLDQHGRPLPGQAVRLNVRRQSPAIGEKTVVREAAAGPDGVATFTDLETTSEYTYAAQVPFSGAVYGPDFSSLDREGGLRITIHTFPTTTRLSEAQVGAMGFVAIEPSDNVFQMEVAVDVLNVGRVTWLPQDYEIDLPSNAQAFDPWERTSGMESATEGTLRFVERDSAAVLVGTVRPGQHRAGFRFQVANPGYRFLPWTQSDVARFELGLPPRVVRLTVLADRAPGLRLLIPGFPDPAPTRSTRGRPVLATSWVAQGPGDELSQLPVTIGGFRTRGSVPFLAVVAMLALLGWGFAGLRHTKVRGPAPADVEQARQRLLDELLELERAHARSDVGPKTYAAARRAILAALARLEEPPRRRAGKRGRKTDSKRASAAFPFS